MDYSDTCATIVKVSYFDEDSCKEEEKTCLIYAKDLLEAYNFVKVYYGNSVTEVTVTFLSDTIVHLSPETVEKLKQKDNYDLTI